MPPKRNRNLDRRIASTILLYVGVLWGIAILVGLILHADLPREELRGVKESLPMVWFDQLLRRYGALIPLIPFLIRWWAAAVAAPAPNMRPASHFSEAGTLYIGLSVARFMIYFLHVSGILHFFVKPFLPLPVSAHEEEHKEHLMSDHLFLAASITAVLTTETILGLGDLLRTLRQPRMDRFRLTCLSVALGLSGMACLLTIGDMYYTAKFFHARFETFIAAVCGWLLFQVPMAVWVIGSLQPGALQP